MGVKEELFSFRGALVTVLHNLFVLGFIGAVGLMAWVWTGTNPIRSVGSFMSQEEAVNYLLDSNPEMESVKLIPKKVK